MPPDRHPPHLSSRHLWAPTQFDFTTNHPVAALLRQVLTVRDLTTLQIACQQGVAVLIGHIREVLAGHTDP